jgi:hypothetical protein
MSIAALTCAGERASLAAIARVSNTIDPSEPHGVSETAILHTEEANAHYCEHADRNDTPLENHQTVALEIGGVNRSAVTIGGDPGHPSARYLRTSKASWWSGCWLANTPGLDMDAGCLKTADELLVWIIVVDRLIARPSSRPTEVLLNLRSIVL